MCWISAVNGLRQQLDSVTFRISDNVALLAGRLMLQSLPPSLLDRSFELIILQAVNLASYGDKKPQVVVFRYP